MDETGRPPAGLRRAVTVGVATMAWLVCFFVLAGSGSWTQFFIAGIVLAAGAVLLGAVPRSLLHLSLRGVGVGLGAGLLMVGATHASYAVVAPLVPFAAEGTRRLFQLLNATGFSPASRAALIVVIASCEEILFRGTVPGATVEHPLRWLGRGEVKSVLAFASLYALATATLGSPLLVVCAGLCGLLWGALRVASGSLVPVIVAHIVWDLGVLVVWPLVGGG